MATGLLCVLAVAVPSSMRPPSWLPVAPVPSPLVPMAAGLWCVLAAAAGLSWVVVVPVASPLVPMTTKFSVAAQAT